MAALKVLRWCVLYALFLIPCCCGQGGPKISTSSKGPVSGDCWQGELCRQRCLSKVPGYVGKINDLLVCCPFCERSGLTLSPSFCACRHNGPDPRYKPTAEELREVEEFKKRLSGSSLANAVCAHKFKVLIIALVSAVYRMF